MEDMFIRLDDDDDPVGVSSCSNDHDRDHDRTTNGGVDENLRSEDEMCEIIKTQISNHPLYPNLLSAYIQCRKVGAPPEMASLLEEISSLSRNRSRSSYSALEMGADPSLDDFMESYCKVLMRLREELRRPLDEATTFLSSIETQLTNLCKGGVVAAAAAAAATSAAPTSHSADEAAGSSEEEQSCGEMEGSENQEFFVPRPGDQELKEMLLRKYSGYISSLRKEFLKKRKKGKLPKDSRLMLLDWWNSHYRWPYPTEEEKMKLAERTGLDQKQINNWFINQRKRHWKPSEDMRFAVMEGVSGITGPLLYGDNSRSGNDDHDTV